jgi:hypothetical protein
MVAPEPTSTGRCGPKLQLTLQPRADPQGGNMGHGPTSNFLVFLYRWSLALYVSPLQPHGPHWPHLKYTRPVGQRPIPHHLLSAHLDGWLNNSCLTVYYFALCFVLFSSRDRYSLLSCGAALVITDRVCVLHAAPP